MLIATFPFCQSAGQLSTGRLRFSGRQHELLGEVRAHKGPSHEDRRQARSFDNPARQLQRAIEFVSGCNGLGIPLLPFRKNHDVAATFTDLSSENYTPGAPLLGSDFCPVVVASHSPLRFAPAKVSYADEAVATPSRPTRERSTPRHSFHWREALTHAFWCLRYIAEGVYRSIVHPCREWREPPSRSERRKWSRWRHRGGGGARGNQWRRTTTPASTNVWTTTMSYMLAWSFAAVIMPVATLFVTGCLAVRLLVPIVATASSTQRFVFSCKVISCCCLAIADALVWYVVKNEVLPYRPVQVFVQKWDGSYVTVDIRNLVTVAQLKKELAAKTGTARRFIRLLHGGMEMRSFNIADFHVKENSTIVMSSRMRGGMHGAAGPILAPVTRNPVVQFSPAPVLVGGHIQRVTIHNRDALIRIAFHYMDRYCGGTHAALLINHVAGYGANVAAGIPAFTPTDMQTLHFVETTWRATAQHYDALGTLGVPLALPNQPANRLADHMVNRFCQQCNQLGRWALTDAEARGRARRLGLLGFPRGQAAHAPNMFREISVTFNMHQRAFWMRNANNVAWDIDATDVSNFFDNNRLRDLHRAMPTLLSMVVAPAPLLNNATFAPLTAQFCIREAKAWFLAPAKLSSALYMRYYPYMLRFKRPADATNPCNKPRTQQTINANTFAEVTGASEFMRQSIDEAEGRVQPPQPAPGPGAAAPILRPRSVSPASGQETFLYLCMGTSIIGHGIASIATIADRGYFTAAMLALAGAAQIKWTTCDLQRQRNPPPPNLPRAPLGITILEGAWTSMKRFFTARFS